MRGGGGHSFVKLSVPNLAMILIREFQVDGEGWNGKGSTVLLQEDGRDKGPGCCRSCVANEHMKTADGDNGLFLLEDI